MYLIWRLLFFFLHPVLSLECHGCSDCCQSLRTDTYLGIMNQHVAFVTLYGDLIILKLLRVACHFVLASRVLTFLASQRVCIIFLLRWRDLYFFDFQVIIDRILVSVVDLLHVNHFQVLDLVSKCWSGALHSLDPARFDFCLHDADLLGLDRRAWSVITPLY